MEWEALIQPQVLIVEDSPLQLEGNKNDLEAIPADRLRELGVDRFVCKLARNVEEAESLFPRAGEPPFDLLLLDLGIPEREGEKDLPDNGQRLLERVRREGIVKEVIVTSVWKEFDQVTRAFRSGAVDFIAKVITTEVLQAKVIECWKRLLGKESARLLGEERISELVPYAEKGLAHRFSTCFAKFVQAVADNGGDIERHVKERYSLDRREDSQDEFFRYIEEQERLVEEAKNEWGALRASLLSSGQSEREEKVETLLREIHRSLLPCFVVKNVALDVVGESGAAVQAFEDNVRAVLKEILVGALNALPDYNAARQTIGVEIGKVNGHVSVSFSDRLDPIPAEDARKINEESNISPLRRFEREWGLSVVQHIARLDAGRLEIKPHAQGNVVTYFIPSA